MGVALLERERRKEQPPKKKGVLDGFSNRVLVEIHFEASKTLYLKAFRSLKNDLD